MESQSVHLPAIQRRLVFFWLNWLQTLPAHCNILRQIPMIKFSQSRSTEMKKKTSVIFNYRFCVNHYTFSVFQCERLCSITRRPGCEVPGSINGPPIIKFQCTNTATASSAKEIANPITVLDQCRSERNRLKSTDSVQINP